MAFPMQVQTRFRKRVPCQLTASGQSYAGIVINVSRGGLFVQTTAGARPGQRVRVALSVGPGPTPIVLGARVIWKRVVAPHLRAVSQPGVGLQIHTAPDAYYDFVAGSPGIRTGGAAPTAGDGERAAGSARGAPNGSARFRVRVKQAGGTRTRALTLFAATPSEARRHALAQVGEGWDVLEVEAL
ncbi:MAG: PilZ domain-containing protein [Deltaproteobacteria bacterium]|nr:MAG: PilZ domain-containing protein [Deltaproteobacteria bacterium]